MRNLLREEAETRAALLEAGLPFTLEKVDFATKKTDQGVDYSTVNSKGSVPTLELDDGPQPRILLHGHGCWPGVAIFQTITI